MDGNVKGAPPRTGRGARRPRGLLSSFHRKLENDRLGMPRGRARGEGATVPRRRDDVLLRDARQFDDGTRSVPRDEIRRNVQADKLPLYTDVAEPACDVRPQHRFAVQPEAEPSFLDDGGTPPPCRPYGTEDARRPGA